MVIVLMAIGEYFIHGYWWLLMVIIWMVVILNFIGGYIIGGYWWW
jgi:hypothetical protein